MRPWPNTVTCRHGSVLPPASLFAAFISMYNEAVGIRRKKLQQKINEMIKAISAERGRKEGHRERKKGSYFCSIVPQCSTAQVECLWWGKHVLELSAPWLARLGNKRCVCMWLCGKANEDTYTHTYCLSVECLHTVVNLCFSPCSLQLHTDLFLFFSCSSGHDSCPWRSMYVYLSVCVWERASEFQTVGLRATNACRNCE